MSQIETLLSRPTLGVRDLQAIYAECGAADGFVDGLISAARHLDPDLGCNALWLLHRAAKDGKVTPQHLRRLAASADEYTHWVSRLSLCQLLSVTGCPAELRRSFHPYLVDCTTDRRVIIRAWALSAMAMYANDPEYQAEIAALLTEAARDPAPSMRARLRHLKLDRTRRERPGN